MCKYVLLGPSNTDVLACSSPTIYQQTWSVFCIHACGFKVMQPHTNHLGIHLRWSYRFFDPAHSLFMTVGTSCTSMQVNEQMNARVRKDQGTHHVHEPRKLKTILWTIQNKGKAKIYLHSLTIFCCIV